MTQRHDACTGWMGSHLFHSQGERLAAMQRASGLARQMALQTNTAIVVVQGEKRIRITAGELRKG